MTSPLRGNAPTSDKVTWRCSNCGSAAEDVQAPSLGPLGGLALKAALLALIFAAAAMNRRWRWALLTATLVVGLVGAASGVLAWSA